MITRAYVNEPGREAPPRSDALALPRRHREADQGDAAVIFALINGALIGLFLLALACVLYRLRGAPLLWITLMAGACWLAAALR